MNLITDAQYNYISEMPSTPAANPLSNEQAVALTEFARACRTAARSVALYPPTHPSIQASLARVTSAALRLMSTGEVSIAVLPRTLMIGGRTPERPDQAVTELAAMMHDRLVGALRVEGDANGHDWHALLLLLARSPEDLIASGGISKAWKATGRSHFDIREIDYAELLREREGVNTEWDSIVALCLRGDANDLDETALQSLLETLGDSARFGELLERLQTMTEQGEPSVGARIIALLELVTRLLEASTASTGAEGQEDLLRTVAESTARLTPDMLIGLIEQAQAADGQPSDVASKIVERIDEPTIASFVARSVERGNGASERLAQALQLLVPDLEQRERLLDLAKEDAAAGSLGQQSGSAGLGEPAADTPASDFDESLVSQDYARELSSAHTLAVSVERVSDDPPWRIEAWLSTVDDVALRDLDLRLLLDLLRIQDDVESWRGVATTVVTEIERMVQRGEMAVAQELLSALVRETRGEGRATLASAAGSVIETLASGPLTKHIAASLRNADDAAVESLGRLCQTVGTRIIGPLVEALMEEENSRAARRLQDILVGFGAAGQETVERLKRSPRAAMRRTAIDLLRMFGGQDALTDLAGMLDDKDPQVQRDAIRAIMQIGDNKALAVLQQALMAGTALSSTITQQLIRLREARAVPVLCYVIEHSKPRGPFVGIHTKVLEALGALGPHEESVRTLKGALYRGEWWAPSRTAALRRAAALALWRIGSPEALEAIDDAAQNGGRGVRMAARTAVGTTPRRERRRP
jgi:HEAT repeat protein